MKLLVTHGSKLGGTQGLAEMVGDALRRHGCEVDVIPARQVGSLDGYDAVIVGGALYAGRWYRDAARFVRRHRRELRHVPVWLFSSGPLDHSAETKIIKPVGQVKRYMVLVGAEGHETFGGRLAPDARGFMARTMAKKSAGDWRDDDHVVAWTNRIMHRLTRAERHHAQPA
jgi:menaquinone-dependent protoporphyrinogen oxidase